jgi:hypothetical protein
VEQVAVVGDKGKETFRYGTNIDLEINPEVSREKEWNFRRMLITLITVRQIHESIKRHTLMRNYCSMCMKLWVSLGPFIMKLSIGGCGNERNREAKYGLLVLILVRCRDSF